MIKLGHQEKKKKQGKRLEILGDLPHLTGSRREEITPKETTWYKIKTKPKLNEN